LKKKGKREMRTIEQIGNDIKSTNNILKRELEAVPYGQRPAFQIAFIQATERLPKLLDEMKKVVIPHRLLGLFASGDNDTIKNVSKFLINNEGLVIDAAQMYRTIADLVEPSYDKTRNFTTTQYGLMIQGITNIGIELGYAEIEPPKFVEKFCPKPTDTLEHIRTALRNCHVGDQANVQLLTKQIVDGIVKNEIDSPQIPVMVIGTASVEERNVVATLFSHSNDYVFPSNFEPTVPKLVSLFKNKSLDQDLV
jgi:hypothetical protein